MLGSYIIKKKKDKKNPVWTDWTTWDFSALAWLPGEIQA